jgi:hypothetical protein
MFLENESLNLKDALLVLLGYAVKAGAEGVKRLVQQAKGRIEVHAALDTRPEDSLMSYSEAVKRALLK